MKKLSIRQKTERLIQFSIETNDPIVRNKYGNIPLGHLLQLYGESGLGDLEEYADHKDYVCLIRDHMEQHGLIPSNDNHEADRG